jgi:hypothetical protein|tara:strand:- start:583 stop:909 length:327 start_codon:yes stop_codon:yes gene_type:complete
MEKKLDLDKVEYMWIWEDDYRKNNIVFYGLKDDPVGVEEDYTTSKTSDLVKLIKEKGVKFYTTDDDHDDKRYGYFFPEEKLMFNPVDQMEGDGHCHTFYKSEGNYKQL